MSKRFIDSEKRLALVLKKGVLMAKIEGNIFERVESLFYQYRDITGMKPEKLYVNRAAMKQIKEQAARIFSPRDLVQLRELYGMELVPVNETDLLCFEFNGELVSPKVFNGSVVPQVALRIA